MKEHWVGIKSNMIPLFYSKQRQSQWCWAACLQMLFNFYGIKILQEDIVFRSYGSDPCGNLPDWSGSLDLITRNLNNWSIDKKGFTYRVDASFNWGAPVPSYLVNELARNKPVLVGYQSNLVIQHAVVIIAVKFVRTNTGPFINSIVVCDPMPNKGIIEYPGIDLAELIFSHWYIRIQHIRGNYKKPHNPA